MKKADADIRHTSLSKNDFKVKLPSPAFGSLSRPNSPLFGNA
jgi:hypothetical protein